jgi:hypothetical protein
MTTPDWLKAHDATLKPGINAEIWYVEFAGKPQYRLTVTPVGGQFGCAVIQAVNGKRLDKSGPQATAELAIKVGLEDLRQALGW